jgi:TrmH RNA methyltransferase
MNDAKRPRHAKGADSRSLGKRGERGERGARGTREKLERIYGLSAALSAFAHRPDDIVSIAHTRAVRKPLADVLRSAAKRRIAYREVDDAALTELAQSQHHEGVCMLARASKPVSDDGIATLAAHDGLIVALDGVGNPHNVGAILRSAAYFGVRALLLSGDTGTTLTAAGRRVAEGGAEIVPIARANDLAAALRTLRDEGFGVFGADARAKVSLTQTRWSARSVLVLGHEQHGLSPAVQKACTTLVAIAGTGAIDSLNVSVAAGIFMASFTASVAQGRGAFR